MAKLDRQGIKAWDYGGSLGALDIVVEGCREDAFRARDLVRRWATELAWSVSWLADYQILPGSIEYEQYRISGNRDVPPEIRVARVLFEVTPSQRVLQILDQEGFLPRVYFGSSADLVFVPRDKAVKAVELLEHHALAGVRCYPFNPADY